MRKGIKFIYELNGNLYINLTNKCCNDCGFCLRRNGDGVKGNTLWLMREPKSAEVIKLIEKADFEFDEAVFCGYGESTYKIQEMIEIADYLHSIGKKTRLNTNGLGSVINGMDIVPLLEGSIDKISVSLNEASASKYDEICRSVYGLDAYNHILDFTKRCCEAGIDTVMTVVDVISKEDIEKCKTIAESVGSRLKVRANISNNTDYN